MAETVNRTYDHLGPKGKSKLKMDTKKESGYDDDDSMDNYFRNLSPSGKQQYEQQDSIANKTDNTTIKPKLLKLGKPKK